MEISEIKLREIFLESELVTESQLDEAKILQKEKELSLGDALMSLEYITEPQLYKALEYMLHVPYVDLAGVTAEPEALHKITEAIAIKHTVIPIKLENDVLTVVMSDPLDFIALEELRMYTKCEIKECIAPTAQVISAIDRYFSSEGAQKAIEELKKEYDMDADELSDLSDDINSEISHAPVVRLVNSIIVHAVKSRASDIHIEPFENDMCIRFRIDGELREIMRSSVVAHSAIVARIKIMSELDISEKRVPQDGRIGITIDDLKIDLRISMLPTVYGEKVVIRILGQQGASLTIDTLGFTETNLDLFNKIFKSPNGIILVSGPTGSGKTTTLYTVLRELNKPTMNIITVEDPVEYKLKGINQVQVNNKAGLTFVSGLRSILRQDPDIIMIGEIRDAETAQIAIRASITGHLVLSTIHTNDAASSVSRLVDMGIEPYLVSSSVTGVIAQRLVRKICPRCKIAYRPDHAELMDLRLDEPRELYKGEGCPACNYTGYSKRTAIHEVLVMTREIRELVDRRASIDQIRQMAARAGTKTLRESCTQLVLDGVTTTSELLKVTYSVEA